MAQECTLGRSTHILTFEYSCKLTAERTSVVRLVNLHVPGAWGPQRPAAGPRPIGLGGRILAGSGFS